MPKSATITTFTVQSVTKEFLAILDMAPEAVNSRYVRTKTPDGSVTTKGSAILGRTFSQEQAIKIAEKAECPKGGQIRIKVEVHNCYKCFEEHHLDFIGQPLVQGETPPFLEAFCTHPKMTPSILRSFIYKPKE